MSDTGVVASVLSVMGLLFLATVLSVVTRRVRIPFTITLVVVGLALGEAIRQWPFVAPLANLQLSPDLLIYIFLPTLVFEAAFSTDSRLLAKNLLPVLTLAVPAVLISFFLAGLGLHWAIGMPLGVALLFGAFVSATDSNAVMTVFRDLGAPKRLNILAQGENLFNDAASIVVFQLTIAALGLSGATLLATNGIVSAAIISFLLNFVGGLLVGLLLGQGCSKLLEIIENDDLIEILLTTVVAYLSFLIAELFFNVSGIMAVVGAGLVLSASGRTRLTPATFEYLERFWTYLAFMGSSLVFLLVGLAVDLRELAVNVSLIAAAVLVAIVSRALSIYGLFPLVNRLPGVEPADLRYQTTMVWGGLRGATTLVLPMSLPLTFAYRDELIMLAFGVVLFTLLAQGTTLELLIRRLGLHRATLPEQYVRDESLLTAKHRARQRLSELRRGGAFSDFVTGELEKSYEEEEALIRARIQELRERGLLRSREEFKLLKREHLLVEKRVYLDLFHRGQLSEKVLKELQHSIELQLDHLRSGGVMPPWTIHSPLRWKLEEWLFKALDAVFPSSTVVQRYRLHSIADRYEEQWGRLVASERVLEELHKLEQRGTGSAELLGELQQLYTQWHGNARRRLDSIGEQYPEYVTKVQHLMAARFCLQAEEEVIEELERLDVLPEREAKALREEVGRKHRRLRQKPLEELRPRPAELLGKVPFFRGLPDEEFRHVVDLLRPRTFLADEVILREGEMGDSLFLIARGVVRVYLGGGGIPEIPIATLLAGDFFGEMAMLTANPRNATVKAVTHCSCYELRRVDLDSVQALCPTIQQVLETTSRRRAAQRLETEAVTAGGKPTS